MNRHDSLRDRWYVTNGVVAVGPLDYDRLRQGVAHGRIPATSFVRHDSWRMWRRFGDLESLSSADRLETVQRLAGLSRDAEVRAADTSSEPPPALRRSDVTEARADSTPPLSSVRPAAVNPVGVLGQASSLDEALLLALSTAAAAANADVGLLHREQLEPQAVVTAYGQGPGTELVLGERLAPDDPSVVAARAGLTLMGEPEPGPVGSCLAARLARCAGSVRGVAMVPAVIFGELVAMIELGRGASCFRAREIARVEDVVEALIGRTVVSGWLVDAE